MTLTTYVTDEGISTLVYPWHRPDIVHWTQPELPSFITQAPVTFLDTCCCEGFSGFSASFVQAPNVPAVPEASMWVMIVVGMCVIMMAKKWRGT